jgi:hypothetical protein
VRDTVIKQYNAKQEAAKVTKRELQHNRKLLYKKDKEEKCVAQEAAKVVRD